MPDKIPPRDETDCLSCRLISGFGLMGIGFYIYAQSKKRQKLEMHVMRILSASSIGIGIARLANAKWLKSDNVKCKTNN